MALVTIPEIQVLDPYYDKVALLFSGNGPNGSTALVDNSFSKRVVTPYGNARISTAQSVFGGSSGYFDGASYVTTPANVGFAFGSGDFTMETWVFPTNASAGTNVGGANYQNIFGQNQIGDSTNATAAFTLASMKPLVTVFDGSTNFAAITAAEAIALNAWSHLAYVRFSTTFLLLVNGIIRGTATSSSACATSTRVMPIGADSTGACKFQGYISDLRITKGLARYTSNFTPPAAEFPWLAASSLGVRAFNANLARRICAPARALAPGGPVTAAFAEKLARRNIYQGGVGRITGTVKEKSLPANVPLHRRVCLLEEKTRLLVAETWSDATTGNYVFERIDPTGTYTVMSYDHTGLYRAVIADAQVPEAMP